MTDPTTTKTHHGCCEACGADLKDGEHTEGEWQGTTIIGCPELPENYWQQRVNDAIRAATPTYGPGYEDCRAQQEPEVGASDEN